MSNKKFGVSPLELLREQAGKTQEEVAEALGVTDHTYRNWVKGRAIAKLTVRQIKTLCRVLNTPLEEMPDDFYVIEHQEN